MIVFCVDEGKCEVSCQKRLRTTSFDCIHSLRVLLSYGYFRYIDYMSPLNHRKDSQPVFMQTVMHYRVTFMTFELLWWTHRNDSSEEDALAVHQFCEVADTFHWNSFSTFPSINSMQFAHFHTELIKQRQSWLYYSPSWFRRSVAA